MNKTISRAACSQAQLPVNW